MLLSEHARTLTAPPLIQVFATDLDENAIQVGREAVYPASIEADVSEDRLRRFFTREHQGYRVRRELRELVLFAVHDVLHDSPFSRLDLVTCRNLLIYLTREAQSRVLDTLHFALAPQGKLFIGSSESVDDSSALFSVTDKKHRIYARRSTQRALLPQAASSLARAMDVQHAARMGPVLLARSFDPAATGAAAPGLAPPPSPQRRWDAPARPSVAGELHLELLERLAPPSVLVNPDYDIVHLSPSAGRFLQLAGGEPSRNVLKAVQPDLRLELRAALYQAAQQSAEVRLPPVPMPVGGGTVLTAVRVIPAVEAGEPLFLVLFEVQSAAGPDSEEKAQRTQSDPLARYLDAEVERLKSQLRDTVEQYEASTEELKASNEELQAMNEEMRAAAEELETSREELQSVNEELATVNNELKVKVEQLSSANSDMQNLMDATQIPTVFLDRELRITRYTPAAVSLFNLIPSDLGRPLTDMATQLDYPELGADAARVLERLVPVEREVGQSGGNWYVARLMPYRTGDDRIGGVVFTFLDITERKRAEDMRLWLSAVVSSTSDAIISFSLDQTVLSWNAGAERLFGYTAEEAVGQPISILAPYGSGDEQSRIVANAAADRALENFETVRRRKDGSLVHVALTVSPIKDAQGRPMAGTAIVRDISASRAAAEALRVGGERAVPN
jgi:two-component system CheB/CheR fusion protein